MRSARLYVEWGLVLKKAGTWLVWSAALSAWTAIAYYLLSIGVGAIPDPLHPLRLTYYGLSLVAPVLTFVPVARLVGSKTFAVEAVVYWFGLVTLFTFVSPRAYGLPVYILFMVMLFGACYTLFVPLGYALGFRLLTLRAHRRDTGRARREAYLAALFVALSAAMNTAGFFNPLNALLLLLILALVESFALARKPGPETV